MTMISNPSPPTDDKRWRIVEATMRRNGNRPDALIETLHSVQSTFGYLDEPSLLYVADALAVSPAEVYGVATFYHYFQLKPQGRHSCSVCTGTACHIKGSDRVLEHVEQKYGIKPGETTEDGELSLLTVRCLGACGLAPAAVFDGEVMGNLTADELAQHLEEVMNDDHA